MKIGKLLKAAASLAVLYLSNKDAVDPMLQKAARKVRGKKKVQALGGSGPPPAPPPPVG